MTKPKLWRRSLGERGLRIHLFERAPGGSLYREVYVRGARVGSKKSLRHRDRQLAESDAFLLLARLKSTEDALDQGRLTLSQLFDRYRVSPSHKAKKTKTGREDEAKLEKLIGFLGREREVRSLCSDDFEAYRLERMSGGDGVRARTVAADLVSLRTALNWACRQRDASGNPLLNSSPMRGIKLPREKNPRRPVETFDRYEKLMRFAGDVDWRLPALLTLLESTGQRVSSLLALRRGDVQLDRLPYGWLELRASAQKTGRAHEVPLTEEARATLLRHLMTAGPERDAPIFPAEKDATVPVSVWVMDRRLRRAYEAAELASPAGGLFHAWRRKWATERKGMPINDVAAAGGWKNTSTLLQSYMQADAETVLEVQLRAPKLVAAAGSAWDGGEKLPQFLPQVRREQSADGRASANQ